MAKNKKIFSYSWYADRVARRYAHLKDMTHEEMIVYNGQKPDRKQNET